MAHSEYLNVGGETMLLGHFISEQIAHAASAAANRVIHDTTAYPLPDCGLLIGLCGLPGVGKDTAFANLPGAIRASFADTLRREVLGAWPGLTAEMLSDRTLKETPTDVLQIRNCSEPSFVAYSGDVLSSKSPRQIMQEWGSWRRRVYGEGYFVNRTMAEIEKVRRGSLIVITDVRYQNEFDAVRSAGGGVVWLVRQDGMAGAATHESDVFSANPVDGLTVAMPALTTDVYKRALVDIVRLAARSADKATAERTLSPMPDRSSETK